MKSQYFDLDQVDLYRFRDMNEFESYLQDVLQVANDIKLEDVESNNFTLIFVQQNGKYELKVFPWNQILLDMSERQVLLDVILKLYGTDYRDLCHAEIPIQNGPSNGWLDNSLLKDLPEFLSQMESEQFYPVMVSLLQADDTHDVCYLSVVSLK